MTPATEEAEQSLLQLVSKRVEEDGLTPAVLQDVVEDLKQKEEQLLHAVFSCLAEEYRRSQQPGSTVDEAAVRLGSLATPGRKKERQVARLAGQHRDICNRIQYAQEAADSLQAAARLQSQLDRYDSLSLAGNYVQAARCAAAAAKEHQHARSEDSSEVQLLQVLAEKATSLAQFLTGTLAQCIRCQKHQDGSCRLEVLNSPGLNPIWEALQTLSEAEVPLQQIASELLEALLLPLVAAKAPVNVSVSQHSKADSSDISLIIHQDASLSGQSIEEAMLLTLGFVAEHLLQRRPGLLQQLGSILWPELCKAYIERHLGPAVPKSDHGFQEFEAMSQIAQDLEASIAQAGFLEWQGPSNQALPLQSFTQHAMDKCLQQQRLQLTAAARSEILSPDYDMIAVGLPLPSTQASELSADQGPSNPAPNTEANWGPEGEEAPILAQGVYQISRTGQAVVELMRECIEKATSAESPAVARSTVLALRDMAALYSALPPVVQRRELQVPQLAALYHNDCQHIAQQLLTLPHCYPTLQRHIGTQLSLAEDAVRLRAAGKAVLESLAEQQGQELSELLEGAEGFSRVHKAQRGIKARKVIQQTLHPLRRIGSVLKPVLTPAAFVAFGSAIIDAAASKVVGDVMSIQDISVEESEDLPRILDSLANEAAAIYVGMQSKQSPADPDPQVLIRAIEQGASALLKLKELLELLGARLIDIQSRWESGQLQQRGFSAAEVHHLVEALFENTDLREAVLRAVQDAAQ